jgi:hypothetical protein
MVETKWEYRVVSAGSTFSQPKDEDLEEMLNELGAEGWEVVAAHNQEGTNKIRIIVKRKLAGRPPRKSNWP